ncbi:MAG: class I SAM-dependent methyltransferase [Acidimicrobiales bacterium]
MDGYDETTYGERFADVYDEWYGAITDATACAALVAELADLGDDLGGGPVLELGVGTGRLAIPIAALGLEVVGVDASTAMLERLTAKAADGTVEAVLGDFADPPVGERRFAVALVAYNTLFNLTEPGAQARCFERVADLLLPGGSFLVEAFVPDADEAQASVEPRAIAADRVVLSVSRTDPARQEAMGQHVDITEQGIRLRPWHIRWSTTEQLDAMAAAAGLRLADRWSDWARTPFGDDDPVHVSRYVRDARGAPGRAS